MQEYMYTSSVRLEGLSSAAMEMSTLPTPSTQVIKFDACNRNEVIV